MAASGSHVKALGLMIPQAYLLRAEEGQLRAAPPPHRDQHSACKNEFVAAEAALTPD
jgi:hypothetical protein